MIGTRETSSVARTFWTTFVGTAIATAVVFGGLQSATATTVSLTGTQGGNTVEQWKEGRFNGKARNYVAFDQTSISGSCGVGLTIGIRNSAGTQFASVATYPNSGYQTLKNVNGNIYQPAGTFYMNSRITGPCSSVTWKGSLQYNILYN